MFPWHNVRCQVTLIYYSGICIVLHSEEISFLNNIKNNRGICMVISTNDLFSMMIIRVCAAADIPKGSKKAEAPAVTASCGRVFLLLQ